MISTGWVSVASIVATGSESIVGTISIYSSVTLTIRGSQSISRVVASGREMIRVGRIVRVANRSYVERRNWNHFSVYGDSFEEREIY